MNKVKIDDDCISRKVLISSIYNWKDIETYYAGKSPKNIPISEVISIIKECPTAGEDMAYVHNNRYNSAISKGREEIINSILQHIDKLRGEE